MFQPTAFLDGENIVVIGNIPHYRYTGATYRDKLKNGLSLDYVFHQEDMVPNINEEVIELIESNEAGENLKFEDYEDNYGFYEQKEFQTLGLSRKGKRIPFKKRQARNMKKTMVKINGYADKLFSIEQELPDLAEKSLYNYSDNPEYDYDDLCSCCGYPIHSVYRTCRNTYGWLAEQVRTFDEGIYDDDDDDNWTYN